MRTRTAAITATALLATLAACSSGSHDNKPTPTPTKPTVRPTTAPPSTAPSTAPASTPPPTTDTPASPPSISLGAAVQAYSAAYFKPDPDAGYAMLSTRCQATVTPAAYAKELDRAVAMYGHQKVKTITISKVSGGNGLATYTYANPLLDQTGQPWTLESGHWRYDDC